MSTASNVVAGTVGSALIVGAAVAFIWAVAPIAGIPLAYWHAKQKWDREAMLPVQEMVFRTVCPAYRDASLWQKWTTRKYGEDLAWCSDYLDRL